MMFSAPQMPGRQVRYWNGPPKIGDDQTWAKLESRVRSWI
jgi:hypothetical protein